MSGRLPFHDILPKDLERLRSQPENLLRVISIGALVKNPADVDRLEPLNIVA
jgi:hypothetical protein